ncbi:glycosyl hydrolase [Methylobacterium segetis]|uniref:glycosyl hydrolase n=1 Tax=Methylobacterium segetis TaxID=2488750 RepID=UPI001052EA8A|nr:glycosyl hydrolase [Methylobacterium segetis]
MVKLGIHSSNDPAAVRAFEAWLGRPVDLISQHTGEASLKDFAGSPGWFANTVVNAVDRPAVWSVPLLWSGARLSEAAAGTYDDIYCGVVTTILAARPRDAAVYFRTGWEFNGDWMKWAAQGQEEVFASAFRRFSTVLRTCSERARLIWCPNLGQRDPVPSFPGSEHVDAIGMDFYHQPHDPQGPLAAWHSTRTRDFGLDWLTDFASRQRKPICIPEWGVRTDGMMLYVEEMARWCSVNGVLFQSYWDSDADYPGKLSGGRYRGTGEAFRLAFGERA